MSVILYIIFIKLVNIKYNWIQIISIYIGTSCVFVIIFYRLSFVYQKTLAVIKTIAAYSS